jgi:hypothetical protein
METNTSLMIFGLLQFEPQIFSSPQGAVSPTLGTAAANYDSEIVAAALEMTRLYLRDEMSF